MDKKNKYLKVKIIITSAMLIPAVLLVIGFLMVDIPGIIINLINYFSSHKSIFFDFNHIDNILYFLPVNLQFLTINYEQIIDITLIFFIGFNIQFTLYPLCKKYFLIKRYDINHDINNLIQYFQTKNKKNSLYLIKEGSLKKKDLFFLKSVEKMDDDHFKTMNDLADYNYNEAKLNAVKHPKQFYTFHFYFLFNLYFYLFKSYLNISLRCRNNATFSENFEQYRSTFLKNRFFILFFFDHIFIVGVINLEDDSLFTWKKKLLGYIGVLIILRLFIKENKRYKEIKQEMISYYNLDEKKRCNYGI